MATTQATLAAAFIILNFVLAYFCLSPRFYRILLGITGNKNPRNAMAKLNSKTIAERGISEAQLERLGRWEACQQNAVENYPLFVAAVIFALLGNFSEGEFIGLGAGYTAARVIFAIAYIMTENEVLSYGRSICWWVGNAMCFWGIIMGARGIDKSSL